MANGGIRIDMRINMRISIRIGEVFDRAPISKRGITILDIQKRHLLENDYGTGSTGMTHRHGDVHQTSQQVWRMYQGNGAY